jgi:DNA-binding response OmpR family regulator
VFCCYRCANFAGRGLPNRAALAADWVANLAMSSRRRNFCFLNLLNLALSPFCDDIRPHYSNLFVTHRAVLQLLMTHAGRPITYARLISSLGVAGFGSERAYLRVLIGQVRKKLEDDDANPLYILTDSYIGYRSREP